MKSNQLNFKLKRLLQYCFFILIFPSLCFSNIADSPIKARIESQVLLSQPLTVLWRYKSNKLLNFTPAATNDHVYLPLATGKLISLKAWNGELVWSTDLGGEISASPLADQNGVYVATETTTHLSNRTDQIIGVIRSLKYETGITSWMCSLAKPVRGSLAHNDSYVFAGSIDGKLYAIRKSDGSILWKYQHTSAFASQPIVNGSRLYIGSEDGTLLVIDQSTGRTAWRYRTHGAVRGPVAVMDGTVCLGSADGHIYALEQATGRLLWKKRTGAGVQVVASAVGGVLIASLDNFAYFLSLRKGEQMWKRQLAGRIPAQPLITHDGALLMPLSADACVVLDIRDGKQLNSIPLGEDNTTPTSPVAIGKVLLVTARDGLLAFINSPKEVYGKK